MIEIVYEGNMFDYPAQALVNPVNCVGVAGKGLALQFKRKFPMNYDWYASECDMRSMQVGRVLVHDFEAYQESQIHRFIINFPTKTHWRQPSEYSYIWEGLGDMVASIEEHEITSIAIPALGCGLGGLDWEVVEKMIFEVMEPLEDVRTWVFGQKKTWTGHEL